VSALESFGRATNGAFAVSGSYDLAEEFVQASNADFRMSYSFKISCLLRTLLSNESGPLSKEGETPSGSRGFAIQPAI
jgi:hypothetical protein